MRDSWLTHAEPSLGPARRGSKHGPRRDAVPAGYISPGHGKRPMCIHGIVARRINPVNILRPTCDVRRTLFLQFPLAIEYSSRELQHHFRTGPEFPSEPANDALWKFEAQGRQIRVGRSGHTAVCGFEANFEVELLKMRCLRGSAASPGAHTNTKQPCREAYG
jgi:hypothetical protein